MLNSLKTTGNYITRAGMLSTFLMAVVGTISIDIVLLAYMIKKTNENNSGANSFLTGYLWGTMFSGNHHHHSSPNPLLLLIASPFLTGIAIGLSFLLGVPQVGIVLALGWGVSLSIVGLGTGISALAELGLSHEPVIVVATPVNHADRQQHSSTYSYVYREARPTTPPIFCTATPLHNHFRNPNMHFHSSCPSRLFPSHRSSLDSFFNRPNRFPSDSFFDQPDCHPTNWP